MKKFLIILACLLLCIPEMHGQGSKIIGKAAKAIVTKPPKPPHVARVSVPSRIINSNVNPPIKVEILTYASSIATKRKANEFDFPIKKTLQESDLISLHLSSSLAPYKNGAGIRIYEPKQNLKFFPSAANTIHFFLGEDSSFSPELGNINLNLSIKVNDDEYYVVKECLTVKTGKTRGRHKEILFRDTIAQVKWKEAFVAFLRDENIELYIKTDLDDKVSQAFFSFCKRWKKLNIIDKVKGDASVRFLVEDPLKISYADDTRTYAGWFLKNYNKKLLLNKKMDRKVKKWFTSKGLK